MNDITMADKELENEHFQDEPINEDRKGCISALRKRKIICLLFIILLSAIIVGINVGNKTAPVTDLSTPLTPSEAPTIFEMNGMTSKLSNSTPYEEASSRQGFLPALLRPFVVSNDEIFPSSSLQKKAFDWIINEDSWIIPQSSNDNESTTSLWLERYIAALLYFAFDGVNWKDRKLWLSSYSTCNWKGVQCNHDGRVSAIDLYNNNLSGSIPSEIGRLAQIEYLLLRA